MEGWFFRGRSLLARGNDSGDKNYHQQQCDSRGCGPFSGIWIPSDHSTLRPGDKVARVVS
jgi:hypothetical protein